MISQHHTSPLPPRLDGRAIGSVAFGALGLLCPIGFAIVAIVLAGRVHRQLDRHGGRPASQDLASVGAALGWCGAAWMAVVVGLFLLALLGGAVFGSATTTTTTW